MIIVLIRRSVRRDKELEFIESYRQQKPVDNPDFIGEELTKVDSSNSLPESMRSFPLTAGDDCVTYINIARWKSREAFEKQFSPRTFHNSTIETSDRLRAVLEIVNT